MMTEEWEKILVNHLQEFDKDLIYKQYKEILHFDNKKTQITQFQNKHWAKNKALTEMKNALDHRLISRLYMTKERMIDLEDISIKTSQTKIQIEKYNENRTKYLGIVR